ncbi:Cytochrome P450 709B2 [Colletotrichum chlorophyti]|uniref:Cytochrome P450 709B2 n=1 Tax=Colletotrichum chlorophyti TaxID=708187 RepID=A0A1Q8RSQ2_9PEZI|nr:Cytochrome P450 709B2 [Colletotrichum chlorophyti]
MESLRQARLYATVCLVVLCLLPSLHESQLLQSVRFVLAGMAVWYGLEAAYNLFIYPFYLSPLRHLPGPKDHHFLIGHVLRQFRTGNPMEPYFAWARRWPDESFIRFTGFGNSDCLLITSLEAFKVVFQTKSYSFIKAPFNTRVIVPLAGDGVAFAEGESHKSQRKLLSPPFALSNVKRMVPIFQSKSKELCDHLDSLIKSQDGVINVSDAYSRVTLDIVAWFTLGVDIESTLSSSVFHEAYQRMFDPPPLGAVLMAINAYFPAIRSLPLEENRQFKSCSAKVRTILTQLIKQRMEQIAASTSETPGNPDLLTYMIRESHEVGDPWPVNKILENCLNFVVAGHETTAISLIWTTHMLTQHPGMQERARREVTELLERKPNPDYKDLDGLRYLENVCKESLRFYAPGLLAARESIHDVDVCGTFVPKGTSLYMMPVMITRNPRIWGEDVDEFNPDRWDHLTGEATDPHAFAAFLMGPRGCIGRVFAVLEMKMILVELLSRFRFEAAVDAKDITYVNPSPAIRPKGGLKVKVHRLK